MAAITIHLPKDVEELVRQASAAAKQSVSAWIADAARQRFREAPPPPDVVKLFGSVPDFELPSRDEPWSKSDC